MNRRQFTALALVALSAACGSDSATGPLEDVSGTYSLRTVNGAPVPFTLGPTQTGTLVLVSASVTLNTNGTFSATFVTRETVGATSTTQTEASSGTWTRASATLSLKDSADGTTTTAQYADGSLTVVIEGLFTLVFRK